MITSGANGYSFTIKHNAAPAPLEYIEGIAPDAKGTKKSHQLVSITPFKGKSSLIQLDYSICHPDLETPEEQMIPDGFIKAVKSRKKEDQQAAAGYYGVIAQNIKDKPHTEMFVDDAYKPALTFRFLYDTRNNCGPRDGYIINTKARMSRFLTVQEAHEQRCNKEDDTLVLWHDIIANEKYNGKFYNQKNPSLSIQEVIERTTHNVQRLASRTAFDNNIQCLHRARCGQKNNFDYSYITTQQARKNRILPDTLATPITNSKTMIPAYNHVLLSYYLLNKEHLVSPEISKGIAIMAHRNYTGRNCNL